jgi:hypothetical protein
MAMVRVFTRVVPFRADDTAIVWHEGPSVCDFATQDRLVIVRMAMKPPSYSTGALALGASLIN